MTTGTGTPRPFVYKLLIFAVVFAIVCGAVSIAIVTRSDDSSPRSASQPGIPTAEAPANTPATDPATQTAAPSPTRQVPENGDERGCPDGKGGVDTKDPYCKKRANRVIYERSYANNPAYKCPDGRNDGLGPNDLAKFVPCINSSLRLELGKGATMTLYASTSAQVELQQHVAQDSADNYVPNMVTSGKDWLIRQTANQSDDKGAFYRIKYFNNPDLEYFATYLRVGGTGDWQLLPDPGDVKLYADTYYQVVVFWQDPRKPDGDAPLPPGFRWSSVAKHT